VSFPRTRKELASGMVKKTKASSLKRTFDRINACASITLFVFQRTRTPANFNSRPQNPKQLQNSALPNRFRRQTPDRVPDPVPHKIRRSTPANPSPDSAAIAMRGKRSVKN